MKKPIAAIVLAIIASTSVAKAGNLPLSKTKSNIEISATKVHTIPCKTTKEGLGISYLGTNTTGKTIRIGERVVLEEWQLPKSLKKIKISSKLVVVQNDIAPNGQFLLGHGGYGCSAWTTKLSRVKVEKPAHN